MNQKMLYAGTIIATLAMTFVMRWHGNNLIIPGCSEAGIVSLELAADKTAAEAMLACWRNVHGKDLISIAIRNTQIDFIYLLCYSMLGYIACMGVAKMLSKPWQKMLSWLAIAALAAGLLDVFENVLMLETLQSGVKAQVVTATKIFATTKFFLLACVLLGFLAGAMRWSWNRRSSVK